MQSDILVRDHRLQQYLRLAFDILAVVAAKGLSDVAESLIGGRALAAVRPDTLVLMWIPIAYWLGLYRRPVQEGLRAGVTRLFECCVLLTLMATIAVTIFGKGAGGEGWR